MEDPSPEKILAQLRAENSRLRKKLAALQALGPSDVQEGVLYKKEEGQKYRKKEGDSRWRKCCTAEGCWSFPRKKGFCHLHQSGSPKSSQKPKTEVYYMTLSERKPLAPKCQYVCQNKSVRNRKGKTCDREAQYCCNDGRFICTNHVNVLKSRDAKIYRKSDKVKIPPGLLPGVD